MSSSLYKNYEVDKKKAEGGVPVTFEPNDDGTIPTFYVKQISRTNTKFTAEVEKATKPLRRMYRNKLIPSEKILEINRNAFMKACLTGWDNVYGRDGKPLPYSEENAKALFADLPQLCIDLENYAEDLSNFQSEDREEEAKNS